MSIAWAYLDKRAASIDALKDLSSMEFIINSHSADAEEARAQMLDYRSMVYDGLPKEKNPHGGETRIAAVIDEIDILRERYRQALEFVEWFMPAWDALTADERYVLNECYLENEIKQKDAIESICGRFHIERSSAYNKKNRALSRLTVLLYGKH